MKSSSRDSPALRPSSKAASSAPTASAGRGRAKNSDLAYSHGAGGGSGTGDPLGAWSVVPSWAQNLRIRGQGMGVRAAVVGSGPTRPASASTSRAASSRGPWKAA
jgi:hypothetical protein